MTEQNRVVLDLSDPLIREMADNDHRPTSTYNAAGEIAFVFCVTCGRTWPCLTRVALRALRSGYQ